MPLTGLAQLPLGVNAVPQIAIWNLAAFVVFTVNSAQVPCG
jgi:hypothetical protein